MLCGLPLVVHSKGGYCEYIEHGVDGFIFDNEEQAYSLIMQLSASQDMRKRIGDAARKKALSIYSDSALEEIAQFYLV
jgi:glycosyltransferase involved in cell wall biosynthesis